MRTATALPSIPKQEVNNTKNSVPKLGFSFKEAVASSSLSRRTLEYAIKEGKLKAVKIGRRTVIPAKALEKFLGGGGV